MADIILGLAALLLLAVIVWFYRYSRTEAFRRGELRRATFELLLVIGPFFGVRFKPPEPEPPAIMTPKGDDPPPPPGLSPPAPRS